MHKIALVFFLLIGAINAHALETEPPKRMPMMSVHQSNGWFSTLVFTVDNDGSYFETCKTPIANADTNRALIAYLSSKHAHCKMIQDAKFLPNADLEELELAIEEEVNLRLKAVFSNARKVKLHAVIGASAVASGFGLFTVYLARTGSHYAGPFLFFTIGAFISAGYNYWSQIELLEGQPVTVDVALDLTSTKLAKNGYLTNARSPQIAFNAIVSAISRVSNAYIFEDRGA